MLYDAHCVCAQYLTKYFATIAKAMSVGNHNIGGISCPAKNCKASYTFEIKRNDNDTFTATVLSIER